MPGVGMVVAAVAVDVCMATKMVSSKTNRITIFIGFPWWRVLFGEWKTSLHVLIRAPFWFVPQPCGHRPCISGLWGWFHRIDSFQTSFQP
jgi:hypothetical protein